LIRYNLLLFNGIKSQQFTIYLIVSNRKLKKAIYVIAFQNPAELSLSVKRPRGAKEEGGSWWDSVKGLELQGLSMWSLAVPYGEDAASSHSEIVVLVLDVISMIL
jgi:hypothetical protein